MEYSHHSTPVKTFTAIFGLLLALGLAIFLVINGTGGFKSRADSPRPPIRPYKKTASTVPVKVNKNCGDLPFGGVGSVRCADYCPCPKIGGANYFCSFGRCLKK